MDTLENIHSQFERQNVILQQMLDIMPRPAGKVTKVLETVVLVTGAFGFIVIADIIVKWIIGG